MCVRLDALVFVVEPSPKSQKRFVIVPVELSVKVTVSGLRPAVGLAVKLAAGTSAPVPITELVLLPPPLVITIALLKLPALAGVNRTTKFVEPNPDRLNGVPETRLNGDALRLAAPLVRAAAPRLDEFG